MFRHAFKERNNLVASTTMHCPPQNPVIPANRSLHYKRPLSTGPKMLRAPIRSAIFFPAFSQWTCLYQRQWALSSCSPVFSCRSCCRMWRCRSGWRTARLSASGWTSRPSAPTDPLSLETQNAPAFGPNKQYVCVQHGAQKCWLWYDLIKTSSAKNNVCSPACCSTPYDFNFLSFEKEIFSCN